MKTKQQLQRVKLSLLSLAARMSQAANNKEFLQHFRESKRLQKEEKKLKQKYAANVGNNVLPHYPFLDIN